MDYIKLHFRLGFQFLLLCIVDSHLNTSIIRKVMKTAILYIRLSTDEQAINGYSQRYQKRSFGTILPIYTIEVPDIIYEDY